MVRVFKKFIEAAKKFPKPRQTTWVYCPGCKVDLVNNHNREVVDGDVVKYFCFACNTVSRWNFDFPVPILIDAYYKDFNDWDKENK